MVRSKRFSRVLYLKLYLNIVFLLAPVERLEDVNIRTEHNGLALKIIRAEEEEFYIVFASSLSRPDQFDQIKDFLSKNGPGLQHIAFKCDIATQVKKLKKSKLVEFIQDSVNKLHRIEFWFRMLKAPI